MITKYLGRLGLAIAIGVTAAGTALATPIELTVTSGTGPGTSVLLANTGGGDTIFYTNQDFNGWQINLAFGLSHSPSLALGGLDLTTLAADCLATTCAPLTLAVSDIGYTMPLMPNGLTTRLSNTQLGANSTITQWAYLDTSNTYFGSTDPNAAGDFGGAYDPTTASLIGTVTVNGQGSASSPFGGSAASGPYSLTLVDQFCSDPAGANGTCSSGLQFSSDGGIALSEPSTLALFGASLLGCALFVSRRRSSRVKA
jgi:hypothetical protein